MATLMERQLDKEGGQHLVKTMEQLGIRVLLGNAKPFAERDESSVSIADGEGIDANLVVVAAGIRPTSARTRGRDHRQARHRGE
jgi:nitrite reductase (NADH) large subunit